jgi:hypothetical protein
LRFGHFAKADGDAAGAGGQGRRVHEVAALGADLEVDLKIQERDIANVEVGQRCMVMPEAYQNFEPFRKEHPNAYDGTVSRMMPTADRSQGAIPVRVKLRVPQEEQGKYLRSDTDGPEDPPLPGGGPGRGRRRRAGAGPVGFPE